MNQSFESISELLNRVSDEALADKSSENITLGEFVDKLADRGFGVLMLLCALPNFFPVNVPGISTIFSVILFLLVGQWMVGMQHPWLPGFIRGRSMSEKKFASGMQTVIPKLQWMEKYIKPRAGWLFSGALLWLIGLALMLQIFFLALPLSFVPFSNAIPAYCIAAIAVGIISHDGWFTLVSMIIGTIVICFFSAAIIEVLLQLWHWAIGIWH